MFSKKIETSFGRRLSELARNGPTPNRFLVLTVTNPIQKLQVRLPTLFAHFKGSSAPIGGANLQSLDSTLPVFKWFLSLSKDLRVEKRRLDGSDMAQTSQGS